MITGQQVSEPEVMAGVLTLKDAIEEVLHAFLPEELREGSPTGFAMVGHIGMFYSCY